MLVCEHVNFIPKNLRKGNALPLQELLITSWVFGILIMLGLSGMKIHDEKSIKVQIEEAEIKAKKVSQSADEISNKAKLVEESNRQVGMAKDFLKSRMTWTEILKELSLLTPRTVWISSLSTKIDAEKQPVLSIVGEADSQSQVAKLLTALESSYYFHDVSIKNSEKVQEFTPNLYRFEFLVAMAQLKEKVPIVKAQ